MTTKRKPTRSRVVVHNHVPEASNETKLNVWLNIGAIVLPFVVVVFGGLYELGNLTATIKGQIADQSKDLATKVETVSTKVDAAARDAQSKVDLLSSKVDANNVLTQAKQDALTKTAEGNIVEQQTFRTSVQSGFSKLFDAQQKLSDQINQERVDRLTDAVKKK